MHIAKGGYRKDLKQYFRSKMEANIARYYRYIREWYIYEYKEFEFKTIKRGQRYYKPDFYLPASDSWVEVKGFFGASDKTKLRRFKKYYPEEFAKLKFIIPDKYAKSKANGKMIKFLCDDLKIDFEKIMSYKEIEKYSKLISGWE
ncbi:hypothetical protein ES695_15640 [Candidatus Atribacteria bacterium 1244-E10-H5-B2]|nr:MAG: hypothetical protein ES695_15640 [Candidatus Atribacteria bacterium 1244-E10-H5-B2]